MHTKEKCSENHFTSGNTTYFGTFQSPIKKKLETTHPPHRVQLQTAFKLRNGAILVSWISLIVALGQGVAAIVLASTNNSQSLFGFGLDALLDCLTSIVVLWRFYSVDVYSISRERRACLTIACMFIFMSLFLLIKSTYSLASHSLETKSMDLLNFTLIDGVVSLLLACIKVYIGYSLESKALIVDSIVTFVGMVMSFAALGAEEINMKDPNFWFIDSTLGIVCSLLLAALATKLIYDNRQVKVSEDEEIIIKDKT